MEENYFKIPVAKTKETNLLVNAKDVPNGIECNCYCPNCKGDLIAVNREIKQRAHFRHSVPCNINGETYIHWLAKEAFKEIKTITIPEITTFDLKQGTPVFENFLKDLKDYFKNYNVTEIVPEPIAFINPKCILQHKQELIIEDYKSEVTYPTPLGDTRIDIVLTVSNSEFYVEPFFTNRINEGKLQKLLHIDKSAISINLMSFITRGWVFTLEEFKAFLVNEISSKSWIHIRTSKMEGLLQSFLAKLHDKLKKVKADEMSNQAIKLKIEANMEKMNELYIEQKRLHDEIKPVDIKKIFE